MLTLNTNMGALSAQRNLFQTGQNLQSSFERLSSGYRITRSSDDAAGLGVAANLDAQIVSYGQAVRNAQDGVSVAQVAEGALAQIHSNLSRMRELAMQSASDGIGDDERAYANQEFSQLRAEIVRVADTAEFNGVMLLSNDDQVLSFQVGVRNSENDRITVSTIDLEEADAFTALGAQDLEVRVNAESALSAIDDAINQVSEWRADFGIAANRLEQATSNAQISSENLAAAHSRIRDVDVASETSRLASTQVLQMAGTSILSQANMQPQTALRLLG